MIRTRRSGLRPEAGFTLLELLVALTLLGLISVVLFGGLRFGTRAWEAGNVRADRLAQVQAVQAMLRRRIAQALPPNSNVADSADGRGTFAGESNGMHFLAVVPSRASVGGIYAIDLAVIEDSAGGAQSVRLEFTWRLHRADDEAEPGDTPEAGLGGRRVLIDGLASAGFRYFGASAPGQAADWHDLWDSEDGLPGLIAIEAEFPEGDGRAWPVLQVAPKLGGSTPASGRGRLQNLGESE
jgi:general secretion pathway protein J